jgi:H2-forming N5,N10-methylenetetrahydromethanopterin dehydrogenase-like enzyme
VSPIDPLSRLRSAGRRVTDPMEALAQQAAERAISLVDVNSLLERVDINALLRRIDMNALLRQVDVNALLDRVDVNKVAERIDMDELVEHTDLGAVIARSSGGMATEALDAARSQAVGLDQSINRWVRRLLRRRDPGPSGPSGPSGASGAAELTGGPAAP